MSDIEVYNLVIKSVRKVMENDIVYKNSQSVSFNFAARVYHSIIQYEMISPENTQETNSILNEIVRKWELFSENTVLPYSTFQSFVKQVKSSV